MLLLMIKLSNSFFQTRCLQTIYDRSKKNVNIRDMTFSTNSPTYTSFREPQALPYDNPKNMNNKSRECAYIQINHQRKRYTMKVSS